MSQLVNYSNSSMDSSDCSTPANTAASRWDTPISGLRGRNIQTSTPLRNNHPTPPHIYGIENTSHKKQNHHHALNKRISNARQTTASSSQSSESIPKLRPRNSSIRYSEKMFNSSQLERSKLKASRKPNKSVRQSVMFRLNSNISLEESNSEICAQQRHQKTNKFRKSSRRSTRKSLSDSSSFETNSRKRFQCPEPDCSKSYSRLNEVGVHYNSFHLRIKLTCPYCRGSYAISYLSRHMTQTRCNEGSRGESYAWDSDLM